MKTRFKLIPLIIAALLIAGCGSNSADNGNDEISQFRSQVDSFCTSISEMDTKINSIDTAGENYTTELINDLNALNTSFSDFAAIDFPAEYDYLEHLADEASAYMNDAVTLYTEVYTNDSLNSQAMQDKFDEAGKSYANAFKRIKVIITFLNGEVSEDASVSTDSGTLTDTSGQ